MPGTTFKSKIYTILNKFTNIERCKRKHSQDTTHITEHPPLRKYSDATSVGTYDSTTSVIDRFRHALPFFRGRGSLNISPVEEMSMSEPFDYSKELEKLHSLYTLAQDEVRLKTFIIMSAVNTHLHGNSLVMLKILLALFITLAISLLREKP